MIAWLLNIFKNPKTIVKMAIDSLDVFVGTLAGEIEQIKTEFAKKTSIQQAQWVIDKVQAWLYGRFGIPKPVDKK